jgi:sugar/nucleoside kinase (ribokinase family)
VKAIEGDHVTVRAVRVATAPTARIAVLVNLDGERTFVTQRGAADMLRPADIKQSWFDGLQVLHLPAYSLLGSPLGDAGARAIELARAAHAAISVDLASIGPLLARGRAAGRDLIASTNADILFATAAEADALQPGHRAEDLLEFAAIAVVKRGSKGATVLARSGGERLRFEVATVPLKAEDTTGAGDAFDAGFLVGWLGARVSGRSLPAALHQAAVAGHKAAARHLSQPRSALTLG